MTRGFQFDRIRQRDLIRSADRSSEIVFAKKNIHPVLEGAAEQLNFLMAIRKLTQQPPCKPGRVMTQGSDNATIRSHQLSA